MMPRDASVPADGVACWHMLPVSGRTGDELRWRLHSLQRVVSGLKDTDLADLCFSLQTEAQREARVAWVVGSMREAQAVLGAALDPRTVSGAPRTGEPSMVMLFPGLGDHYVGMGRHLRDSEAVFREHLEECSALAEPLLGFALLAEIYPEATVPDHTSVDAVNDGLDFRLLVARTPPKACDRFERASVSQPSLFAIEYSLARLWQSWGLTPAVLMGYSLGEYVAACLAGVLSLADALQVVTHRAQLIELLDPGAMLAVPLTEDRLRRMLTGRLSIAAVNGPMLCVVAGPVEEVEALEGVLRARGTAAVRIRTAHAYHCSMMEPIAAPLERLMGRVRLSPPRMPMISSMTGRWLTASEATDPAYFSRQLCMPVRFGDGLAMLPTERPWLFVEAGAGRMLTSIVRQRWTADTSPAVSLMRSAYDRRHDHKYLLEAASEAWLAGATLGPDGLYGASPRGAALRLQASTAHIDRRPEGNASGSDAKLSVHRHASGRPGASCAVEETLAGVWRELLGEERLNVSANLFDVGLNSLTATRFLAFVKEHYGVPLSLRLLYERPTIGMLSLAIQDALLGYVERLSDDEARELLDTAWRTGPTWPQTQALPPASGN